MSCKNLIDLMLILSYALRIEPNKNLIIKILDIFKYHEIKFIQLVLFYRSSLALNMMQLIENYYF